MLGAKRELLNLRDPTLLNPQLANAVLHHRRRRIEHVNSRMKRLSYRQRPDALVEARGL
jgi:hypothetical protein